METVAELEPVQDEAFYRPSRAPKEALFNEEQQKAFDKAFSKRERKLHEKYGVMHRDLMDTIEITQQILARCKDRISVEDECAILDALKAMRSEYGEAKWKR